MKIVESKIISIRKQIARLERQMELLIINENINLENKLKGSQMVAFIGEFFASKITNATICKSENQNYDLEDISGRRIEVKTRTLSSKSKKNNSWCESSAFTLTGNMDPTHLCFVLINDEDYSLNTMWLFDVPNLIEQNRIHKSNKKTYFRVNLKKDILNVIYKKESVNVIV